MATEDDNTTEPKVQLPWESIEPSPARNAPAESLAVLAEAMSRCIEPPSPPALAGKSACPAEMSPAFSVMAGENAGLAAMPSLDEPSAPSTPPSNVDSVGPVPIPVLAYAAAAPTGGGGWTIPFLCAGIALIACCLIIPQADANRRVAWQRAKLQADLEQIERQITVNDEFLHRLADDPTLAERLAQRQMKVIREGTSILELKDQEISDQMSPFLLVNLPPPAPMPEYRPVGGVFASLCRQNRPRLYLMGGGLMLVAAGLVLGYGKV